MTTPRQEAPRPPGPDRPAARISCAYLRQSDGSGRSRARLRALWSVWTVGVRISLGAFPLIAELLRRRSGLEAELVDEPLGLACPLGVVGLRPGRLLGDPGRDEPQQGRALPDGGLDDGFPLLDAPNEPSAPRVHLRPVVIDLAAELHLVKHLSRPERKVLRPAGVDAA